MNSWKASSASAGCGSIFPVKSCWDAWRRGSEESGEHGRRGKDREPDSSHFWSIHWLCVAQLSTLMEKNWALAGDQTCWVQALQFSVHRTNSLGILLKCDGFTGAQKATVDQTARPPVTGTFSGASLALGSALELLLGPTTEQVIAHCHIKSTFPRTSEPEWEVVCWCSE